MGWRDGLGGVGSWDRRRTWKCLEGFEGFERFACLPHLFSATDSAALFLSWSAFLNAQAGEQRKACCGVIEQCSYVMPNYMMTCKACPVIRSASFHFQVINIAGKQPVCRVWFVQNTSSYPTLNSWTGDFVNFKLYTRLSAIAGARGLIAYMSYRSHNRSIHGDVNGALATIC